MKELRRSFDIALKGAVKDLHEVPDGVLMAQGIDWMYGLCAAPGWIALEMPTPPRGNAGTPSLHCPKRV